jgi:OmpA-OmpF porin, OOP family
MSALRPLLLATGIAVAVSGCASSGRSPLACVPILCSFVGERPAPPPPTRVAKAPSRPPAPPAAPPVQERLVLRGANFATNSAAIDPVSEVVLDVAADQLRERPVDVVVEGHTDSVGSEAYNEALSQRRADSVLKYLVRKGVPAGRLTARGFGESNPVASNDTAEGRAMNRRVELEIRR